MAESDKREAILAAARLLLLKQGLRATSMEAVAAEAGVAKATLYKYYGDKDAVFAALVTGLLVTIHGEFTAALGAEGTLSARVSRALAAKYGVIARFLGDSAFADELLDEHHRVVGPQVRVAELEAERALVEVLRGGAVREAEKVAAVLNGAAYGLFRKGGVSLDEGVRMVVEGVLRA